MKQYTKYKKNGNLIGRVPKRLVELVDTSYSRTSAKRVYKLYLVILHNWERETKRRVKKNLYKNQLHYVPISKSYFRKIATSKYYIDLAFLKSQGFIEVETHEVDPFVHFQKRLYYASNEEEIAKIKIKNPNQLFDNTIKIETYKVGKSPKKYAVLELPTKRDITIEIGTNITHQEFRLKNERFLKSMGISNPKIFQDNFGYRLYHNYSRDYKLELPIRGEFIYYDVKSSIPHQIRKIFLEEGLDHAPFLNLFDGDFYENFRIAMGFNDLTRSQVKKKFATILYAKPKRRSKREMNIIKTKFPCFYNKLSRNFGRDISIQETKFMLINIVNHLPVMEALTIHDGFIIYPKDETAVDTYLIEISKNTEGFTFEKSIIEKYVFCGDIECLDDIKLMMKYTIDIVIQNQNDLLKRHFVFNSPLTIAEELKPILAMDLNSHGIMAELKQSLQTGFNGG